MANFTLPMILGQSASAASIWASTIVAIGMMAMVVLLMAMAVRKSGMEGAAKMWALLGTIVGVLSGSVGTYFFTGTAAATATKQASATTAVAASASEQLKLRDAQFKVKDQEVKSHEQTITLMQKDLVLKEQELERVSREHPEIKVQPNTVRIPDEVRRRFIRPG